MKGLQLAEPGERLSVLCLGAHSDDIEIGAGATILRWIAAGVKLDVHWCVLSANGPREAEARASAADFLAGAERARIEVHDFRDGFFPDQRRRDQGLVREPEGARRARRHPDPSPRRRAPGSPRGQPADLEHVPRSPDPRVRDPEVGWRSRPAQCLRAGRRRGAGAQDRAADARISARQRSKDWFDAETFRGLARLRGMECRAPERYAEAFFARKLSIS